MTAAEDRVCYQCHDGIQAVVREGKAHGPVGDGKCTACHEPHTAPEKNLLAADQQTVCAGCHGDLVLASVKAKYHHPETGIGACTTCHDPHADALGPVGQEGDICGRCHGFGDHTMHPVGPEVKDPVTGKPVTCVSCHNPHGSEWEGILSGDPGGPLCVKCHIDKIRSR
ncbi:MAG: cytochrome c3 family protein [Candidatus Eisenbacteria bacterium]